MWEKAENAGREHILPEWVGSGLGQGRLIFREISALWGGNADLTDVRIGKGSPKGSVEPAWHLPCSPKASNGMLALLAQLGL